MADQDRCACTPPYKVCCWCFNRLSPAEKARWLHRLRITGGKGAPWWLHR